MKKQPWYVYVLLGALAAGLVYLAYFKPRQIELAALRTQRLQIEDEVNKLRTKKRQLDKIEAELVSLNKSLAELEVIIPRKKEASEIVRNMQQLAFDSQLELIRIAPDREINKDFYSEQPIPIEVSGNYHNLGLFFDKILHFPRIFNIDDFLITAHPNPSAETTITARFTARTYFFLEETQIKKSEPVKPKKSPSVKDTNEI